MRKLSIFAVVLFVFFSPGFTPVKYNDPDTEPYQKVLSSAVAKSTIVGETKTKINYAYIVSNRADLDQYLQSIGTAAGELSMAYYINTYNACVMAGVINNNLHTTRGNVTDVRGFFDAMKYKVAGKDMPLNEIESYIRTTWKDPRIHFALCAGAQSSAPLSPKAYSADKLEEMLNKATTEFLEAGGMKINDEKKEIQLSKIFDWYKTDFGSQPDSVTNFLEKHVKDAAKLSALKAAVKSGYKVTYQYFSWKVNAK
jgi:hypothetical protein